MFKRGDVARIDYKWPQDEDREDGTKTRACTVLTVHEKEGRTIGVTVIPHHGLMPGQTPRAEDAPYAIALSRRQQRELGLLKLDREGREIPGQKISWIMAHRSNTVQLPQNPAVQRTIDRRGNPTWSSGQVPEGLLKKIEELRALAIANGHLETDFIARSTGAPGGQAKARTATAPAAQSQTRAAAAQRGETAVERDARMARELRAKAQNKIARTPLQADIARRATSRAEKSR